MSFSSTNVSGGRWLRSPTAHSVTADPEQLTRCWCIISLHRRTILKRIRSVLIGLQIIVNDCLQCVVLVIFWGDACAIHHEFIVVNGKTAASAFHKVV